MTSAAVDTSIVSLGYPGRRPLPIAMMVYSLGFVGAGVFVWRTISGIPTRRLHHLYTAQMAASDSGQPPRGAGDP